MCAGALRGLVGKVFQNVELYSWAQRFPPFSDPVVRVIESEIRLLPEQRILDLGTGTGDRSSIFPTEYFTGIDIDPTAIAYARRRYKRGFLLMDALRLGLKSSSVDWIMAAGFFHHLADPDAHIALSEARRVLKPSGKMLALTAIWPLSKWNLIGWTVRKLDRGEYIRTYDEFSRIFSVHFAIEKHYPFRMLLWDLVAFILLPKKTTSRYRL